MPEVYFQSLLPKENWAQFALQFPRNFRVRLGTESSATREIICLVIQDFCIFMQ